MAHRTSPPPDIPSALANFDSLPDSAHVRAPVVAALRGCSVGTVWRQAKAGEIPKPIKLSPGVSAWNVGALRRCLTEAGGV